MKEMFAFTVLSDAKGNFALRVFNSAFNTTREFPCTNLFSALLSIKGAVEAMLTGMLKGALGDTPPMSKETSFSATAEQAKKAGLN